MNLPGDAYQLTDISPKAYEHPADRAATAALASVPMLDQVVRKLIEFGYERALRSAYLGSSVRLGHDQLPEIYRLYKQVLVTLDMPDEYELYVTQMPVANAMAIGTGKPIIVLNSGLVDLQDDETIRVVLAHECGHILSDHVLYRTALEILLRITTRGVPLLAGLPLLALAMGSGIGADPWAVLTTTATGQVLLLLGVALEAAGLAWSARLVRRALR